MRKALKKPQAKLGVIGIAGAAAILAIATAAATPAGDMTLPSSTLNRLYVNQTMAATASTLPMRTETPQIVIEEETDVEILAKLIWGEARGVDSDMEKAAVVWCVLNRADDPRWPDTIEEVVKQPWQFAGYSPDYPATQEHKALAQDVLSRWQIEQLGLGECGRVLPREYVFFTGDGKRNWFKSEFDGNKVWTWMLSNPYRN